MLLVGREPDPPYNRPDCSKGYLRGEETREEPCSGPTISGGSRHRAADPHQRHRRSTSDAHGEAVEQAGGRLRQGADRDGRERPAAERRGLRARADPLPAHAGNADAIREGVADAEQVVLIGGSYIGCEVAASLTMMGKRCTIVMQEESDARTGLRPGRRPLLPGAARGARRDDPRPATSSSASRARIACARDHAGRPGLRWRRSGRRRRRRHAPTSRWPSRRAWRSASGAGCCAARAWRARCPASSPPGTSASTSRRSTAAARAHRALGRGLQPRQDGRAEHARRGRAPRGRCPTSSRSSATGASSSTSGRPTSGTRRSCAARTTDGSFTNWYLKDGVVKAALTVGRSDDLDHARRLIADGSALERGAPRARSPTRTADLARVGS